MDKHALLKATLRNTGGPSQEKLFGLGLGAQRCGSTWLGKYLNNHPEFYIPPIKEMHIFDTISREKKHPLSKKKQVIIHQTHQDILKISEQEKGYYEFFDENLRPEIRAFGEITPEYSLLSQKFLESIANSHPNTRIFVSLRRPIGRYLSALTYYGRLRPKFNLEKNYLKGLRKKLFCHYTQYTVNITNLLAVVPREKICFLFYEDLFNGTTDALFSLCDHLQIKKINPEDLDLPQSKVINKTTCRSELRKPDDNELLAIYKKFEAEYTDLPKLIHKQLPQSWEDDRSNYG